MANTNTAGAAPARRKKRDTRQLWAFGFCLPNILFFLVFFVAPAIVGVWYSLTNYNGFKQMDFVGLSNYIKLFRDPEFYKTLWQTILYSIVSVPLGYAVALGLGLLLSSEKIKGITILRILIYWPILLSTIMVGLTWRWIFGESFGLINYLLQCIGLDGIKWATNPTAAFITTIIAGIWSGCGTNMLHRGAQTGSGRAAGSGKFRRGKQMAVIQAYYSAPFKTGFLHGHHSLRDLLFQGVRHGADPYERRSGYGHDIHDPVYLYNRLYQEQGRIRECRFHGAVCNPADPFFRTDEGQRQEQ